MTAPVADGTPEACVDGLTEWTLMPCPQAPTVVTGDPFDVTVPGCCTQPPSNPPMLPATGTEPVTLAAASILIAAGITLTRIAKHLR